MSFYGDKITYQYGSKLQKFNLQYNKYLSYNGISDNSGAYVFRPANPTVDGSMHYNTFERKTVYAGNIISVLHLEGSQSDT